MIKAKEESIIGTLISSDKYSTLVHFDFCGTWWNFSTCDLVKVGIRNIY